MTPAEILTKAAELLEKPGAWTQGAFARTATGEKCFPGANAVCWCAGGALTQVSPREAAVAATKAYRLFDDLVGGLLSFNDHPSRTQAEVVAKLREAAAKATGAA